VWDAAGNEVVATPDPEGHEDDVLSVSWYGSRVATGGHDRTVRIWDTNTGAVLKTFVGHEDSVWCVAWARNGSSVISGGGYNDCSVLVWDIANKICVATYVGHTSAVSTVVCQDTSQLSHIPVLHELNTHALSPTI
jgi:WD40 repeat protein